MGANCRIMSTSEFGLGANCRVIMSIYVASEVNVTVLFQKFRQLN